jgi:hypothetical protein
MTQGTHPACVSPANSHGRGDHDSDDAHRAPACVLPANSHGRGDHDSDDAHRAPASVSPGSGADHDGGGDSHPASIVSADIHGDLHAVNVSADLGAVAQVGDLLSLQVALDIGHDCFHI